MHSSATEIVYVITDVHCIRILKTSTGGGCELCPADVISCSPLLLPLLLVSILAALRFGCISRWNHRVFRFPPPNSETPSLFRMKNRAILAENIHFGSEIWKRDWSWSKNRLLFGFTTEKWFLNCKFVLELRQRLDAWLVYSSRF